MKQHYQTTIHACSNLRGRYFLFVRHSALLALSCIFSLSAQAEWIKEEKAESLQQALTEARTHLDFRLRYQDAEQGNQGGQALTLRSRFGFETLPYELFSAYLEVDDVRALPDDDNYNSGSNGQLDDLFIEDPQGTQLNQIWLAYDIANTLLKYGRQSLNLNNGRLLGVDEWRQHEQSFSGFSISNESLNYLRFDFAQINQVLNNEAPSEDSMQQDLNAKLLNINYRGFWLNDLSLYSLWISDHPDQRQWESSTYGLRFAGAFGGNPFHELSLDFQLEIARQEDAGSNPQNYQANYHLLDLTLGYQRLSATVGFEKLGADGEAFFVTPLGSLAEFQGRNGIFDNSGLGNIPGGVRDRYLEVAYRQEFSCPADSLALTVSAGFHDYRADAERNGIKSYGDEWFFKAVLASGDYDVFFEYADYQADQLAEDRTSLWLGIGLRI